MHVLLSRAVIVPSPSSWAAARIQLWYSKVDLLVVEICGDLLWVLRSWAENGLKASIHCSLTLVKCVAKITELFKSRRGDIYYSGLLYSSEDMGKRSSISIVIFSFWASVVVVAAQSPRATERFTLPGQSANASCTNVDCQQGTCVPNDNVIVGLLFPYKCECNPGWATLQKIVPLLNVPSLPCNVPNCSLNANCAGASPASAPSPSSSPVTSANISSCLVPGICGHGTCEPITGGAVASSFKCVCDTGYANVLNMTGGYCVSQCELNGACQNLNITSPPPPGAPTTPANQTANAGYRGISFDSGLYIATALSVAWSFLSSQY